jgi:cellulose biosynthesis protein BcsQ
LRRVIVCNEAVNRTRLGQSALTALKQLGEAVVAIPSRIHYAAASTAGESVLTYTDRQLPSGIPVPEQPAAVEMWKLWRALSEPALGGNPHV